MLRGNEVHAYDQSTLTFRQQQLICLSHSFPINPSAESVDVYSSSR
ncbi:MAG: hypothetical protein Nkreftii_002318 [Candidatus Nitrospira kreftii]|uniref:Uncharacterized protein n=1 Tax=Candidatus Nitrospira kreftii TaxID=2652173 RepID=A0A7S8IZY0_9BACT|nr:MAG: hypothetical protein Nkreftii_002318 [Candidatus Nitrospira kreftii]